jgi:hypothetical protein
MPKEPEVGDVIRIYQTLYLVKRIYGGKIITTVGQMRPGGEIQWVRGGYEHLLCHEKPKSVKIIGRHTMLPKHIEFPYSKGTDFCMFKSPEENSGHFPDPDYKGRVMCAVQSYKVVCDQNNCPVKKKKKI